MNIYLIRDEHDNYLNFAFTKKLLSAWLIENGGVIVKLQKSQKTWHYEYAHIYKFDVLFWKVEKIKLTSTFQSDIISDQTIEKLKGQTMLTNKQWYNATSYNGNSERFNSSSRIESQIEAKSQEKAAKKVAEKNWGSNNISFVRQSENRFYFLVNNVENLPFVGLVIVNEQN